MCTSRGGPPVPAPLGAAASAAADARCGSPDDAANRARVRLRSGRELRARAFFFGREAARLQRGAAIWRDHTCTSAPSEA